MFAPAMLLGLIGGILGATFTIMNLKIARTRRRLFAKIKYPAIQKAVRFMEPPVIMVGAAIFDIIDEHCLFIFHILL